MDEFITKTPIYLFPSYFSNTQKDLHHKVWSEFATYDSVFLCSSGTSYTRGIKSYQHSKKALQSKAKLLNQIYKVTAIDRFLGALPSYHIGGLMLKLRANLSGAKYIEYSAKWSPLNFFTLLEKEQVTIVSLVPTQLHDLVKLGRKCPPSLRVVYIGGDAAPKALLDKAFELGWPLVICYGMTETAAQICGSYYDKSFDGFLNLYPGHNIYSRDSEYILESEYLYQREFIIAKDSVKSSAPSEFIIPDIVEFRADKELNSLKIYGRKGSDFKYKGKFFHPQDLKLRVQQILLDHDVFYDCDFTTRADDRTGVALGLKVLDSFNNKEKLITELNKFLAPEIHIDYVELFAKKEKTTLGKIKR